MRFIKYIVTIVIIILLLIGIYVGNNFLKEERLIFYSTGTDVKAFFNATWEMSEKEVERANNCELTENAIPSSQIVGELKYVIDRNRMKSRKGCSINFWGDNCEITYDFFDDKLYQVRIFDDVRNKSKRDSLIVTRLKSEFGEYKKSPKNKYGGNFSNENVNVDYLQFSYFSNEQDKVINRLIITLTYQPLYQEIIDLSMEEQENIL